MLEEVNEQRLRVTPVNKKPNLRYEFNKSNMSCLVNFENLTG